MERYIYSIEVDCYKTDGKFEGRLLCRKADDAEAPWQICNMIATNTVEHAFIKMNHTRIEFEDRERRELEGK